MSFASFVFMLDLPTKMSLLRLSIASGTDPGSVAIGVLLNEVCCRFTSTLPHTGTEDKISSKGKSFLFSSCTVRSFLLITTQAFVHFQLSVQAEA